MILDAKTLTSLESCPRQIVLSAAWQVRRWRAKALFDACLRVGIARMTNGTSARDAATEMKGEFLQAAANPGLDLPLGSASYKIAKDYAAMLDTVLRAAARWNLPALQDTPAVPLGEGVEWQPLAAMDATGELHRIVTVDAWTDAAMARELHGWFVAGDTAATGRGMMIHVVEIGRTRKGRRESFWARGWKRQEMPSLRMRFVRKSSPGNERRAKQEFKGQGWKPVYLADYPHSDPDVWVEGMVREGVADALVHHVGVRPPGDRVRQATLAQMLQEGVRMTAILATHTGTEWTTMPMHRAACDAIVPCPWQHACYATDALIVNDLSNTGLYVPRERSMLHAVSTSAK